MRIALYPEYSSLNGRPVFAALIEHLKSKISPKLRLDGFKIVEISLSEFALRSMKEKLIL